MRKIPTLFVRDPQNMSRVLPAVNGPCAWVIAGDGVATRKYDGTCVALDLHGNWYARREVKMGKIEPLNFEEIMYDEVTGKRVGWEPIAQSAFAKYHAEALRNSAPRNPGTYELIGPKINGNPENASKHILISHAEAEVLADAPRHFNGLAVWLATRPIEGVVWHHPDGRMAKIKRRDFSPIGVTS